MALALHAPSILYRTYVHTRASGIWENEPDWRQLGSNKQSARRGPSPRRRCYSTHVEGLSLPRDCKKKHSFTILS